MKRASQHRHLGPISLLGILSCLMGQALFGQAQERPAESGLLRIGLFIDRTNEAGADSVRIAMARWADSCKTRRADRVSCKVETDQENWIQSIESGSHDLYGLFAYQYLGLQDQSLLRPAFVTAGELGSTSSFLLVTRRADQVKSIRALRDKKILVDTGGCGDLPLIWLATEIAANVPPAEIETFAKLTTVSSPARALLPVYFGKADACVISQSDFKDASALNYEVGNKLHFNFKSNSLLISLFAFSASYSLVDAEKITSSFLRNSSASEASSFLDLIRREAIFPFDESALGTTRALFAEYKKVLETLGATGTEGDPGNLPVAEPALAP